MKLGEALTLRADVQKRLAQLQHRLRASVISQEGDAPPEDPAALLTELDRLGVSTAGARHRDQPDQRPVAASERRKPDERAGAPGCPRHAPGDSAHCRGGRRRRAGALRQVGGAAGPSHRRRCAPRAARRLGQGTARTRHGHPGAQLEPGARRGLRAESVVGRRRASRGTARWPRTHRAYWWRWGGAAGSIPAITVTPSTVPGDRAQRTVTTGRWVDRRGRVRGSLRANTGPAGRAGAIAPESVS